MLWQTWLYETKPERERVKSSSRVTVKKVYSCFDLCLKSVDHNLLGMKINLNLACSTLVLSLFWPTARNV